MPTRDKERILKRFLGEKKLKILLRKLQKNVDGITVDLETGLIA